MYLTEPRLIDVVKQQVRYKFNAYTSVFNSLLIMQIIGIIFGFGMTGNIHSLYGHSEAVFISRENFTGDMPVFFTLIWAFTTGFILTTRDYRNEAFSFVSTRLSHHLSSFIFIVITSCIAGLTMTFAGSIIKFSTYFRSATVFIEPNDLFNTPVHFLIMIITAILYTILLASIGYVIGSFTQKSKFFIFLIVIGLTVLPMLQFNWNIGLLINYMVEFFGTETSLFVFLMKVSATVLILFTTSVAVTNKLEVRK